MVLHKNKHKLLFVKRGAILLQAYVYISLLYHIIFEPVVIGLSLGCVPESIKASSVYITTAGVHLCMESSHTIFTLRFLSHYAHIQRSQSINIDKENANFIVKYYKIFGNANKLFIICLITTIIQGLLFLTVIIFYGLPYSYENYTIVSGWVARLAAPFWIVRLFITFYCFLKSKHFEDYWLISREFKYLIASLLAITSCFIIKIIAANIIFMVITSSNSYFYVGVVVYTNSFLFSVWALTSSYISVIWVNKMDDVLSQDPNAREALKFKVKVNVDRNAHDAMQLQLQRCSDESLSTTANSHSVNMFDVLTNKECKYACIIKNERAQKNYMLLCFFRLGVDYEYYL